jgi:hypothetical protein
MDNPFSFYSMYCINIQCNKSVYWNIIETSVPFNEVNLLATHICEACNRELASALDIELEQITAEMGIRLPNRPSYII